MQIVWRPGCGDGRSYIETDCNVIYWQTGFLSALYHEAGHIFEHENQYFLSPAKRFIKGRATGAPATLADLTGDTGYGDDEVVFPDNFSDPYVGKIMPRETEVLSYGMQVLGDVFAYVKGINDMEHLKFCFGCFLSNLKSAYHDNTINLRYSVVSISQKQKQQAWNNVIDKAMTESFKESLLKDGIEKFTICKFLAFGTKNYYLQYDEKNIKGMYRESEFNKLARMVYIAICNIKNIIPDATQYPFRKQKGEWILTINCDPPTWFTPLTELPRF